VSHDVDGDAGASRVRGRQRRHRFELARAAITINTVAAASGLTIEGAPATLHFASLQDVIAWPPVPL
jgi:hypothetical protein